MQPIMLSTARPAWIAALWVTLLAQTVASFLVQTLPAIAPLMTAESGLRPETIGNLASITALGTVLFLLAGGGVLARFGPVRTLQAGALVLALATLVGAGGSVEALSVAALLIGIGYAPAAPAGSQILAETAPPRHRTLIFSVKQAGAPLGGTFAGLLCAPVAGWLGWRAALLLGGLLALANMLVMQPQRAALDRPGGPALAAAGQGVWRMLAGPLAALRLHPRLPPLIALATALSTTQGCLFSFTVTWLVTDEGLGLVEAGGVFAAMQAAGVVARLALGWLADRTGQPARNVVIQSFAAAFCMALFVTGAMGSGGLAMTLMAAATGALAASWNGIIMSEVATLVPRGKVGEATAGCTLVIFLGYLVGPSVFAGLVAASGSWRFAFLSIAVQLAVVALAVSMALLRLARAEASAR